MFYFLNPDFWKHPLLILLFVVSLGSVIFLRYALVSIAYKKVLEKMTHTQRNSWLKKSSQMRKEIKWSMLSSLVFTVLCAVCLFFYQMGWTRIYEKTDDYSLWYFYFSPFILLLAYETYYYWLHRWMHRPTIFRWIHKIHHDSLEPTVFTAFSFHPSEAFLQFLFFPFAIVFIPLHLYALATVFTILTFCAMVNHSGIEIYGKGMVIKHLIGASHHDLHHLEFKTNFGLNFTWWDKAMKTTSKKSKS